MNTPGKKHFVMPQEIYDRLMAHSTTTISSIMQQPEKKALMKSEQEMKNVWEREDLPDDEKVRMYTRKMNNFKHFYDLLTQRKPVPVVLQNETKADEEKEDDDTTKFENDLISSLLKTACGHGQNLLNYLKSHSNNKVDWNREGEFICL